MLLEHEACESCETKFVESKKCSIVLFAVWLKWDVPVNGVFISKSGAKYLVILSKRFFCFVLGSTSHWCSRYGQKKRDLLRKPMWKVKEKKRKKKRVWSLIRFLYISIFADIAAGCYDIPVKISHYIVVRTNSFDTSVLTLYSKYLWALRTFVP